MRPVTLSILLCLLMCLPVTGHALDVSHLSPSSFDTPSIVGNIEHPELRELSGLIRSGVTSGRLWGINDSGSKPRLYALDDTGKSLGTFSITGATNQDWEDLAIVEHEGNHYLVIADIGDNLARHRHSTLYFVAEPTTLPNDPMAITPLPIAFQWTFRYEDGPRDAESIAFDAHSNAFLILSKRDVPPGLYSLPAHWQHTDSPRVATRVTTLDTIPQPDWSYLIKQPITGTFASQPTAMDISPDGKMLAVLTYRFIYVYHRNANDSWAEAVKHPPTRALFPPLLQAESLTFDHLGKALFISSEFSRPPLVRIDQSTLLTPEAPPNND